MKIRKTRQDERTMYSYPVNVEDGRGGYITEQVTIRPGEAGVTEADIKTLHSLDDSEVYYNNKNMHPSRTNDEKEALKQWRAEYIDIVAAERGQAPSKQEVDDAVKEKFPTNWNLSLDYLVDDNEDSPDKSKLLFETSVSIEEDSDPEVDRLHEVMDSLTAKQRRVLQLVWFDGYSLTETAKLIGTSIPNVKKHLDKAMEYIRKNF